MNLCLLLCCTILTLQVRADAIRFIENKGQWESNVLSRADIPGGVFFLEKNTLTYYFFDEEAVHEHFHHQQDENGTFRSHTVKVHLANANPNPTLLKDGSLPTDYNYFIGNDPSRWASQVKAYTQLTLKEIYPGIDLQIISKDEHIKYNFIVHPGANPKLINMVYEGQDDLSIADKQLFLKTTLNTVIEDAPYAYQPFAEEYLEVRCKFQLKNKNRISFNLGSYNPEEILIIDPEVVFSTFSGSVADNFGYTATYDDLGNGYAGGSVFAVGFPATAGAFEETFQGGVNGVGQSAIDIGVLKFSPDGTNLLYATYIGGTHNEHPQSMVVNSQNELIIFGTTFSSNFPMRGNPYNPFYSGAGDIYVCKLNSNGQQMLASTFVGGTSLDGLNGQLGGYNTNTGPLAYNYGDRFRGEVIVDRNDNVYVASSTFSSDFPYINGFQNSLEGSQEGCVFKLNSSLSSLSWSSFLGGSDFDAAYGIAIDQNDNVFVCGGTRSNNFPSPTNNVYQPSNFGSIDGYVAKIAPSGNQLIASTFIGTNQYDQAYFVQIDADDRIYLTGQTKSDNFPVQGNTFRNLLGKQFISIFENDLSDLFRSTVFGSGRTNPDISPSAFLVDVCGNIYVSGWGGNVNSSYNNFSSNTRSLPITHHASAQKTTDGSDFYLIILSKHLADTLYGSYYGGGTSNEHVDGGTSRFDKNGIVYQSVCAGCGGFSDFPTTTDAYSRTNNGKRPTFPFAGGCNNALFKFDLNPSVNPPQFQDTLLVVTASDLIEYNFEITDEEGDSIFFTLSGPVFSDPTLSPLATYTKTEGAGKVTGTFRWQTACNHISSDTFVVDIQMQDNACPLPRSSTGQIKILVQPPPKLDPPQLDCAIRLDSNSLQLDWTFPTAPEFATYHKTTYLIKKFPDGTIDTLNQFATPTTTQQIDLQAPNHRDNDYCYHMVSLNVCDVASDLSNITCTKIFPDSLSHTAYNFTRDTFLTVIATESINYNFSVQSKTNATVFLRANPGDFDGPDQRAANTITFTKNDGLPTATGSIQWTSTCADLLLDTLTFSVTIWNDDCPSPKTTETLIKIKVLPPPVPLPPILQCTKRLSESTIQLTWLPQDSNQYISHYVLVREDPNGSTKILDEFDKSAAQTFTDLQAFNHGNNNYCYYVYGVNICDMKGANSANSCTEITPDLIPDPLAFYRVTVKDNDAVQVEWYKTQDIEFEKYLVYRKEYQTASAYTLVKEITDEADTVFIDEETDVHQRAYCYVATQANICGLESDTMQRSCSILLKGATEKFKHDLFWNGYEYWSLGVSRYDLQRSAPVAAESTVGQLPEQLNPRYTYVDDQLDDDYGLYWYKVVAHEADKNGNGALSESNIVELVQKPIVFVPTAFTPNDDGLNDFLRVTHVFVKDFHLRIFNRWGEKIYDSHSKYNNFDGTFDGVPSQEGVYIYTLRYTGWDGTKHYRDGSFTLLR